MVRKMVRKHVLACLAVPAACATPAPALAQADLQDEVTQLRGEVEALRAEIRAMRGEIAAAPPSSAPSTSTALASAPPAPQVMFKGAPEFRGDNGWSFKPRGRMQFDVGYVGAPASGNAAIDDQRGLGSRVRRAYIGAQGTIPGGFSYTVDYDLAGIGGNAISTQDIYLAWNKGPYGIIVGQQHPFTSMEQMTSDLFTSFLERAAFTRAFNYERRLGVSGGWHNGQLMINAGLFTDDMRSLANDAANRSWSIDGRVVWMPRFGDAQLHFAVSGHYREPNSDVTVGGFQYRARPYTYVTDIRYTDTGLIKDAEAGKGLGLEFLMLRHRLHVSGEAAWLHVVRADNPSPTFFGGYAEAGFFLTDDSRSYKSGVMDRVTPTHPVSKGGLGALEVNLRYDRLDLTSKTVMGGTQDGFGASLIWTPEAWLRFMADYMRLNYNIPGAPIRFDKPRFGVDVAGMRAQVDF